jgi:hypothetical protein
LRLAAVVKAGQTFLVLVLVTWVAVVVVAVHWFIKMLTLLHRALHTPLLLGPLVQAKTEGIAFL